MTQGVKQTLRVATEVYLLDYAAETPNMAVALLRAWLEEPTWVHKDTTMRKINPARISALNISSEMLLRAIELRDNYTDVQVQAALGLLKSANPHIIRWMRDMLERVAP